MTLVDDRGLANGGLIFAAVLVVGALMVIVLDPVLSDIFPIIQDRCTVSQCTTGEGYVNDAWTYFPWFALLLASLLFIRVATTESRRAP